MLPYFILLTKGQRVPVKRGDAVVIEGGRWDGRTGTLVGTIDTKPWGNGGRVIVVDLEQRGRATARQVRVRMVGLPRKLDAHA